LRKSARLIQFEAKHGRPAASVIAEAINTHGSMHAAARALGVSHNTLFGWCFRLGIRVETTTKAEAS
jgi:hypothetical protein